MKYITTALLLIVSLFLFSTAFSADEYFYGKNLLRINPDVTTYVEGNNGVATFVEGVLTPPAVKANQPAVLFSFLEENKAAFRMKEPSEEILIKRIDVDQLGLRHFRLQQHYEGLKVIGGEMTAHFNTKGALKGINGNFVSEINLETAPTISFNNAIDIAKNDLISFWADGEVSQPELVIFPWEGENYLCWRMFIYTDKPMGRWEYFVNAHNGEIIFNANRIMNENDIGSGTGVMGGARNHIDTRWTGSTYEMKDYTRQLNNNPHGHDGQMPDGNYIQTNIAGSSLPGSIATDSDNLWTEAPAVDGHVYTALVYDWLLAHFGRNGYNDNGASMLTIVNYSGDGDNNAYWDGSRIVVWSWSTGWRSLAGCPDVIAHEWGHAVTENTSNLVYQKEPGALNESFSDMLGAAFEWMHDSLDTPDWDMGENGRTTGIGFRDMENPHNFGDPDTYGPTDPYWIDVISCSPSYLNDYCGVHTNSGVGNKWFFLLSDGGLHNGVTVAGIGVENAILVAYQANAFYWNSQSDYHSAALGTISAADDLDGTGVWSQQVALAWEAVGVDVPGPTLYFSYPQILPGMLTPQTTTSFFVDVFGSLGGEQVAGSGQLHYSVDEGAWVADNMTVITSSRYEVTLPALNCDQEIRYYFSAEELTNGTFYDPDTTSPFTAIVATDSTTIFHDNFETDLGWIVSGDATDGQWQRGIPVDGDRGDPPTDYDGSGRCYVTDNVSGNSDVDGGTTILTSPTIDLGIQDALVEYARWYNNSWGDAPFADEMYVYISNNNGSNWTLVETVGPTEQAAGDWFTHSFWVSDFVTPTTQMKLRFEVSDLGSGSVVEAGVDAVKFISFTCNENLPVFVTNDLPDWTIDIPYSQKIDATGGTGALVITDRDGDLVGTGLAIATDGWVTGTPTVIGDITFTARVTDDIAAFNDKQYSFFINQAPRIITLSLPNWTVGHPYSQQLTANLGTGVKTFSDLNSDLVGTGLTITPTGLLSGTVTSAGVISFTVHIVDEVGATDDKLFDVTFNETVDITTLSLPEWTAGYSYSQQLTVTGGTGALIWSDKNNDLQLTGLSLDPSGLLSGLVLNPTIINFTALATDNVGATDEQQLIVTINPSVNITTVSCPDWTVNRPYSYALLASGGTGSLVWSDLNSDLSGTGLTIDAAGLLSGTPASEVIITFTAKAVDQVGDEETKQFSFIINPEIIITTTSLPDWTVGVNYSQTLHSTGGTVPVNWSDLNSDLTGSGLTLDNSGLLSGTPTSAMTVNFTAHAEDVAGDTEQLAFSFVVNPAIVITTVADLPNGLEGEAYSQQLNATGGTGLLSWTDVGDLLAGSGLTLSGDGLLSGTPLISSVLNFTGKAEDAVGGFDEKAFNLIISPSYVCGDADGSGEVDISDAVFVISFIFEGGPAPDPVAAGDSDCSGGIDISDAVYLISFIFDDGPAPCDCAPPAAAGDNNNTMQVD